MVIKPAFVSVISCNMRELREVIVIVAIRRDLKTF